LGSKPWGEAKKGKKHANTPRSWGKKGRNRQQHNEKKATEALKTAQEKNNRSRINKKPGILLP